MSFTIAVEPDLVSITLSGTLTDEDLRGIAAAAPDFEGGAPRVPNRITDMTAVTEMQVAYPGVQELAEKRRALTFPNDFKSAILVRGEVQLGMARMFQTLNDNPQITIEIFTNAEEARAWLHR